MTKKREPGIDLIRCLGLLFVCCLHTFYFNGFYFQPQTTAVMLIADGFRWLFYCANGIFMMLTGYLKTTQPFGKVIYGYGNNGGTDEGARYKNVIYTNCIGPVLVKNPWFTEDILKDICLNKFLGLQKKKPYKLACDSFDSAEEFVMSKKK